MWSEALLFTGQDKYRSKTKEGSGWMSKFPDDVATAERLTNGDPEILNTPKFSPEEKPDISYLFGGEKKPPKKKKDKEDRKSFGPSNPQRKITHPRFRGSSDHEVRIRTNQYSGSSLPSTPENTNVRNYDCPVCSFTSTRVNVLISHVRSHKSSGYESPLRPRASLPPKASRTHSGNSLESPKRKYVRKTKSMSAKASSNDKSPGETNKRKYSKNIDNKIVKKKKTDPELREKLLADWDIGSSDEEINTESFNSPKEELEKLNENNKEELETEKLKENNKEELEPEKLKDNLTEAENAPKNNENNLIKLNDKDEKSKFSCFDFDEDEPEPPVTIPVRKLGRVFGEKTSLKKEIIKEFNKSQELENKRDEMNKLNDDNKLLEEMNKEADDIDNLVAKISKTTSLNSPKKKLEEEEELSFKSGTSDTLILSRSESDLKSEASGLSEGPELLGAVASESDNLSSKNDQDQEIPMEVDNKEEELEILEIIETEEIEAEKSAEDEKVPLKNSPELEKKSKIMRYSDLERVTIEEEETLPVRSTIGQKSGNLSMGWSQLNEIIGSSLEKNSETPAPVKRGRGRPPKAKNLNSLVKEEVKEVGPKIKEYERKTSQSESDTERSYSGRRRKPNKKYLEDAYSSPSSSSGFAFRTDDSQSEEEKKEVEKPVVVKRKRGRPLGWKKNKNNKVSEVREPSVEFELSETLDSVSEEITEAVEVKERVIDPVDSLEGFEEVKVDKEDKEGRVHLTNLTSAVEIRSVLKEDLVEIDIEDQIGPVAPEATPVDDYNESQTQDQVDRAKLMNDLEDQDDDASGFSEKVEILPPKKSQIKKFELSQIDESQIDLENEIKKHVDEEAGLGEKPKIEGEGMEDEGEEEDEELKPTTLIEEPVTNLETIEALEEPTKPDAQFSEPVLEEPEKIVKLVSSPGPMIDELESTIPVKKREKPRIIENVQLKEPMHILKSKLLEKPKGKHKLDDHRLGSKAKIIKLDPSIKRKGGMSYGQKIQVLKAADANDKLQIGQPETVETISIAEGQKLIQSSNLEGMELDINSMPFVLSEDLTPDSIEQMPMVISSIMPTSSGLRAAAQSLPRAAPALAPITSDIETITVDASPKKKASPAILKTKPKAKPTITSIKTLSSPVGGIKSLKFQNTKTSPMVSQKNTPSKYVIVQAGAGGQQMRYMIQGKPTTKVAKVAAPLGNKPSTNPQIVSQGGKVVILTSPQSGQAKVVPFKNSLIKGQVKMPKIDSPTTSKSPKIVTSLLGSKSIVGSPKTILSPKPGQVYTPSNLLPGTSKTILPMPGKITGVVPGKGTVLTPITGQQVKAIAAKSPGKPGPKVTYQLQKGLPMVAKMQKIPISPAGSPVRNSKPTGIVMTQKTPLPTKKLIRPAGPPGTGMPMGSPVQGVDKIVKSPRGRGRTKPEIKPQVKSLPKIKSKEFTGQLAPGSPGQPGQPGPSNSLPVPGLVPTATAGPSVAATENLEVLEQKEEKAAPQIMALPTESSDGTQTYVLVTIDDQGQIQPLDNNTLMSLEGTIQNPDGTRTLYIDPASLGEGNLDNIVLQFDNSAPPGPPAGASSSSDFVRQVPTTNQDILAAALANTDFQQEILPETTVGSLTAGLTATSLINQTILQSTIIPTSEPISSPSVLETSLTLNQPIMTPLEVPTSLPIQVDAVAAHSAPNLEMPITMTNPAITYIQSELPGNSMPDIGEVEAPVASAENYLVLPSSEGQNYAVSMAENITIDSTAPTPSMPIIDDGFSDDVKGQQGQVFEEAAQEQSGEVRDMPIVADETSMEVDHVESEVQAPVEETLEKIQEVQQEQVPEACGLGKSEPSQSYEPSSEIPTQSKSQSTEASPVAYEEAMVEESEPPTQSYDDVKAEATQSYNVPTQSFSEDPARIDDPDFPTQSYEVEKPDNVDGDGIIETDGELSQEGNIPSQSNDIDGIGTSFMGDDRNSCNIAGTASGTGANFNEDETASSSYVPETPETQERDQDQESAISTSSYEIPTCEEINIASSSVIPDTSVDAEHTSIHNNGVPEIPTSSYNLNPDSSSGGSIDAVPSSSYEDNQVESVVEQNVSTSYQVPISMPGLEGNAGFDTSEATQSYFVPEGPSPSYQPQTASPSYYEPPPESEATQSYYSQDLEQRTADVEQSASQSYYQESTTSSSSGSTLTSSSATTTAAATTTNDEELRLGQVGEATPTYSTERYPVDYNIDNSSPIDRHDLVESSVSATPQPTESL
ncbi:Protein of unknown function [Cotesia congregata]|uniref:Uncharacterized protein n=1 Tax=Cotesia congregata TaxID=51543 RepID=A0A8J2HA28_COTCN|nr:Protein of unknown function [Cotesia congregata]